MGKYTNFPLTLTFQISYKNLKSYTKQKYLYTFPKYQDYFFFFNMGNDSEFVMWKYPDSQKTFNQPKTLDIFLNQNYNSSGVTCNAG